MYSRKLNLIFLLPWPIVAMVVSFRLHINACYLRLFFMPYQLFYYLYPGRGASESSNFILVQCSVHDCCGLCGWTYRRVALATAIFGNTVASIQSCFLEVLLWAFCMFMFDFILWVFLWKTCQRKNLHSRSSKFLIFTLSIFACLLSYF